MECKKEPKGYCTMKKEELDKSWHLAENETELKLTEFEFLLWRVFFGFTRWQEDCQSCVDGSTDLMPHDIAILHVIRMKDRPKTQYELCKLLDRDDLPNISYSIRKLVKLGLIEKSKKQSKGKVIAYQVTKAGLQNTENYKAVRKSILIKMFEDEFGEKDFSEVIKVLSTINNLYNEAGIVAASHKGSQIVKTSTKVDKS
jgi:predicted MarR family transcription regulator